MKILIAVILLCFYTINSASGFWLFRRPPSSDQPQDCMWMEWSSWSICRERTPGVSGKPRQARTRTRGRIHEQHGGRSCVGRSRVSKRCSMDEIITSNFFRTIGAAWYGGAQGTNVVSSVSFRSSVSTNSMNLSSLSGTSRKKCVDDVLDADGNILMSGRACPNDRTKRDAAYDTASTRKRTRRASTPSVYTKTNRDVLFVIDESASVGFVNFKKFVRMAKALTRSFAGDIRISKHTTRVGVLTFNRLQFPQMNFDDYFDKATLLTSTGDIRYHGSPSDVATCLIQALEYTRSDMLTSARGARTNGNGTQRLVILMTDGCANCNGGDDTQLKNSIYRLGDNFANDGVPVITFLVSGSSTRCFKLMKGLTDGTHCFQQYWAPNWAKLDEMSAQIETYPPMESWMVGPLC